VATNKPTENLSAAKLKAIWRQITPADWLVLLQECKPDNKWALTGNTIKGLCVSPGHQDTTPSFVINLDRGSAHCFGASCNYSQWNPIRFIADVTGVGYATAVRKLKSRFNIRVPNSFVQGIQQIEDNDQMKHALMRALNLELMGLLEQGQAQEPEYDYAARVGFATWFRTRQFPEDTVHTWPVGILPPRDRLVARLKESGGDRYIEPATAYLSKYMSVPGAPTAHDGSLVYFFFTSPTTIGRLRLRHPGTKDFYAVEDPYCSDVGFFGLNMFNHLLGELENYPLHVVEGEMDALAIISHQTSLGTEDVCVVATGGSMENDLDSLMEYGFHTAHIIPDNDPEGAGWAKNLLSKNKSARRIFRWDSNDTTLKIKDIDEAIRAQGFLPVIERLALVDNLPHGHEWVGEQLEKEMANVDPTDVRERCRVAAELGSILCDDSERNYFLELAGSAFNIDRASLVQNMAPDDDSPEAFIPRLAAKLKEEYYFLSQRQQGMGVSLVNVWSRRKRVVRTIPIHSKSLTHAALASDLGALNEYIRHELGMPHFMQYRMNSRGLELPVPMGQQESMLQQCFQDALHAIVANTTHKDWLTELGQGVHWLHDLVDDNGTPTLMIANGPKLFRGTVYGDMQMKFEEVDNPVIGHYFFRLQSKPWSRMINSVKDLESGIDYNPRLIFESLLKLFRVGWKFRNHDLESMFLAADSMYSSIFSAFHHLSMVDIAGETHSGKTTLMQVIGGNEFSDIRLCEAVLVIDDFSAAGIRQAMNGVRLRMFLDEFEDDDIGNRPNRRSLAVRDVLELIRSMTSGSSKILRGTASGDHLEYNLHFPATVGGIFTMQEPRDINRFVHIRTQRMEGCRDPVTPIRENFTSDELMDLRRGITLCLLPRIPTLLKAYEDAKHEFADNASLPSNIMTRMKDHFLPIVAILKLVGADYTTFLAEFSKIKMEEMEEQGGMVQESASIWDHLLYTQFDLSRFAPDSDLAGYTSISKILTNHTTRLQLNASDAGVYYIERKKWMVVFWQKAMTGILRHSPKYRNVLSPGRLKIMADADTRSISKENLKHDVAFLRDIRQRVGTNVRLDQLSVVDLTSTLSNQDCSEGEEDEVVDARVREQMLSDIPGPESATLMNPIVKQRGNFEV